jgi:DNA-binding transcriptional LysR family regulator
MTQFPEMRLDIELSDRIVDLVDEGFDCAVRIGAIGGQNLVGRRVGTTQLVCCARKRISRATASLGNPRTSRVSVPPVSVRTRARHLDVRRPHG